MLVPLCRLLPLQALLAFALLGATTVWTAQLPLRFRSEPTSITLSNGIQVSVNSSSSGLTISQPSSRNSNRHLNNYSTILETPSTFLIASTGSHVISDSSGNFELTSNATDSTTFLCGGVDAAQSIDSFEKRDDDQAVLSGKLSSEGCEVGWKLIISTNLNTTHDSNGNAATGEANDAQRVRLTASVTSSSSSSFPGQVRAISFRYKSSGKEQFWGLGSQPSFMGLRGARIPIWTREGGVGRGDNPVTRYLNDDKSISGAFAGGSELTTYTAIGSWTTTLGRWGVIRGPRLAIVDLDSYKFGKAFSDTASSAASSQTSELPNGSTSDNEDDGLVTITYDAPVVSFDLGVADQAVDDTEPVPPLLRAVTALTRITGRQPRIPAWTQTGAVLGIQGGQTKVESIIRTAASQRLPLAAVWLQDWCGTRLQPGAYNISISRLWWNWEPDSHLYPTWPGWVNHLNETYGVRTLSYVNTFLANVSSKPTGFKRNLYEEAVEQQRFVLNQTVLDESDGTEKVPWTITSGPGIDAGLLDLSNEATKRWFKNVVKEQIFSSNISGAMQDFGEYLSTASDVHIASSGNITPQELSLLDDGKEEAEKSANFHNQYPLEWAKLLYEVSQELNRTNEIVGFHRSASTFSAPYTNLFWVGDQNIDFAPQDGLRSVIPATIHMGFSGFGISHSDIGGYTNTLSPTFNITRSKALLGRWGEVGALTSALFRTHEGNIPTVNQQAYSNNDTWAYHRHNTKLFVALAKYRQHLINEYHSHGWPLVRPTQLYSSDNLRQAESGNWTFFLGDRIFVSPIYDAVDEVNLGTLNVTIPLPRLDTADARYRHIWTNQTFAQGETAEVKAAFGLIPAFIVENNAQKEDARYWSELHSFVQNSYKKENQLNLTSILAN